MPKVKTVTVRLQECYKGRSHGGPFTSTIMPNVFNPTHPQTFKDVPFTTLNELGTKLRVMADAYFAEYGHGCVAMLYLPKGKRKPAGFDAFQSANRHFNLTPEEGATEAECEPNREKVDALRDEILKELATA